MPFTLVRDVFNAGSFLFGYSKKGARDIVTLEVKTGETITRGMLVGKDGSELALVATDAAGYTFVGIAVSKPFKRNGIKYVRIFRKGVFKMTATSIIVDMEGYGMYVKTSTTVDDNTTNDVRIGKLVKYISATKGWVDLNVTAAQYGA